MRVRHIPTGNVVDWPDRFAAFQIAEHGDAYEPADDVTVAARPAKRSKGKRKSTATDNGSDTVPGDTSEGGTPDSQE